MERRGKWGRVHFSESGGQGENKSDPIFELKALDKGALSSAFFSISWFAEECMGKAMRMGKKRRYAYGLACGLIVFLFIYRIFSDFNEFLSSPALILIIILLIVNLLASLNSFFYDSSLKVSKAHGWIQTFSAFYVLTFLLVAFIEISTSEMNFSKGDWFFLFSAIVLSSYLFVEARNFQKLAKIPPPLPQQ